MSRPEDDFDGQDEKAMAGAVAAGNLPVIEALLGHGRVSPVAVGRDRTTWLIIAIAFRQRQAFELLLRLGALGDGRGVVAGETLYAATIHDDMHWLRRLRAAGADLNNFGGGQLLSVVALFTGRPEVLDFYLENGIELDKPAKEGGTLALAAARIRRFDVVNRLLEAGASPWTMDVVGSTLGQIAEKAASVPAWRAGTPMDQQRLALIARLKSAGFPFPPPTPREGLRLRAEGRWPPRAEAGPGAP